MIWFKEGEDEKETDLGLSLAGGGGGNKETERKKNWKREEKRREKVIYILHQEAF